MIAYIREHGNVASSRITASLHRLRSESSTATTANCVYILKYYHAVTGVRTKYTHITVALHT